MAILAGDALLTLAFETLAGAPLEHARRVAMIVRDIAAAAGTRDGMVGGQVADLEAERQPVTRGDARVHSPLEDGGADSRVGRVRRDCRRRRRRTIWRGCARFGEHIGWAFQVTDDILDVEESSAALGKTAGKDQAQQKATYPALFGLAKSHEFARELATRAIAELDAFGARAGICESSANFWFCGAPEGGSLRRRPRLRRMRTAVKTSREKPKERLDVLLVERGLAESRQKAQAMILAGEVRVNGQRADKAGTHDCRTTPHRVHRAARLAT